jgi:hypothetical protein
MTMTDPDRLARIKRALDDGLGVTDANLRFLLAEVDERDREINRLREVIRQQLPHVPYRVEQDLREALDESHSRHE